ncbi:hypothetical protein PFLUV_G00252950 [Perca fluviatilis]|uniref:Secreted protein n=1 Tax=Perca fluviatilis TaxID=8168 RepID=A0A6A5E3T5_PERFL|nr:hypothetical protein PFLUV_G00252950 [Perca fluviatilis]
MVWRVQQQHQHRSRCWILPSPAGICLLLLLRDLGGGRETAASQHAADPRRAVGRGGNCEKRPSGRAEERQHPGLQERRGEEKERGSPYAQVRAEPER